MKWLPLVLLTGCASAPQLVRVPVPVACVETLPTRPTLVTDDDLKGMSDYRMALALRQYHLTAGGYISELEAVLGACQKQPLSYTAPAAGG